MHQDTVQPLENKDSFFTIFILNLFVIGNLLCIVCNITGLAIGIYHFTNNCTIGYKIVMSLPTWLMLVTSVASLTSFLFMIEPTLILLKIIRMRTSLLKIYFCVYACYFVIMTIIGLIELRSQYESCIGEIKLVIIMAIIITIINFLHILGYGINNGSTDIN
jgi:hypothetical protein